MLCTVVNVAVFFLSIFIPFGSVWALVFSWPAMVCVWMSSHSLMQSQGWTLLNSLLQLNILFYALSFSSLSQQGPGSSLWKHPWPVQVEGQERVGMVHLTCWGLGSGELQTLSGRKWSWLHPKTPFLPLRVSWASTALKCDPSAVPPFLGTCWFCTRVCTNWEQKNPFLLSLEDLVFCLRDK